MENKINIAEILKDCPKGMELDCVMFENVTFEGIKHDEYPIIVKIKEPPMALSLTKIGGWNLYNSAKCVIFPKGKTTWKGFHKPFKDGDIYYIKDVFGLEFVSIIKKCENNKLYTYVDIGISNNSFYCDASEGLCYCKDIIEHRLATEEEKKKLFDAIKSHGYKWNEETKTLEKLVEPKFKVGDKIQSVISSSYYTVVDIKNDLYFIKSDTEKYPYQVSFSNEINYELVPNKFDITTLKPFDKVLMRSSNAREWVGTFYSHYSNNKFYGCGMCCDQCVPYEENQHLLGTTNDCDEYFKNWE